MRKALCPLVAVLAAIVPLAAFGDGKPEAAYLPGGPLAGLELPLFKTQHGEPPGYPGAVGTNKAPRWAENPKLSFDIEGMAPQLELYPGSVELFEDYMQKYMPIRSWFDRQSQLRNWKAAELPGVDKSAIESYAAPLFWVGRQSVFADTGLKLAPVPVARLKPGGATVKLDLGRLPAGLYALRVIAAVEPGQVKTFRRPLVICATVNDGPDGEDTIYRVRAGYCEEFYDVADVYFHVPLERACRATIQSDAASQVDLLVHNLSLDDALAGTLRRPIKTRAIETLKPGVQPSVPKIAGEARLARDADLWNSYVPPNALAGTLANYQYDAIPGVVIGTDTKLGKDIEAEFGVWKLSGAPGILVTNAKLGLSYSLADLQAGRPLPDPYPFKDDGLGLIYTAADKPDGGRVWAPVAQAVIERLRSYFSDAARGSLKWVNEGDSDAARDAAVKLIRFALAYPTLEDGHTLNSLIREPGAHGREFRTRSRESNGVGVMGHFGFQFEVAPTYDRLFSYIKGNEDLAKSIGRFRPKVKSSADLVQLLDVYLLQTHAKRLMRYHYAGDGREPAQIAEVASVLGDNTVTDSWMEWLFSRVFYYPRPLAGLADFMVSVTDRDGRSTIGSSSYVMGDESADKIARSMETYIRNGGNPAYDLTDFKRFPKAITSLYFPIRGQTAGLWTMRMGSVSGPEKGYAQAWKHIVGEDGAVLGWKWTKDPIFAYVLKHYGSSNDWSGAEWAEIGQAAATVPRAPWMENRSRILPNHAAFLESGVPHDDVRFRRSVQVRLGTGKGHSHCDTLDLQVFAHGFPVTLEAGQRPGYSNPPDWMTRVHNTVEVNGSDWSSGDGGGAGSWACAMSDAEGARYLRAQVAPNNLARASRQVALIDVDEGEGSAKLGPEAVGPDRQSLPNGVVTPQSYVFDVFRVNGGGAHTYCFHAGVNDLPVEGNDPQPVSNARDVKPVEGNESPAGKYLAKFANRKYEGVAPERFEATFTIQKTRLGPSSGKVASHTGTYDLSGAGVESSLLGSCYDSNAPSKFVRLQLFNAGGGQVMKGDLNCHQWKYFIPMFYVQRKGENLQSAFAALIEPYAGTPFIREARQLPVEGNDAGAEQAVALEVKTVNGHTDLCFAGGAGGAERRMGDTRIAAEFAYSSVDTQGVRQLTLTGGTLLSTPLGSLRLPVPAYTGRVVSVDYPARTVRVDAPWPEYRGDRLLELKTQPGDDPEAWATGLTAASIKPKDGGTEIAFVRSVDFYRARIAEVDEAQARVKGPLGLPLQASGFRRGWTASNDRGTKTWRVRDIGDGFILAGDPVQAADFAPENVLRLWEYGVGDVLTKPAMASLRRVDAGVYELTADAEVTVALRAGGIEISADRQQWKSLSGRKAGGLLECAVKASDLGPKGQAYLRVK